jgi:uncharacterized membrane protein YczE
MAYWLWTVKAKCGKIASMSTDRSSMDTPQGGPSSAGWPLWARLTQLLFGLVLFGVSEALLVRSDLGLDPWDVFHQGLSRQTNLAIGTWSIIVGAAVLLLWIPLRQRPGIGTVSNVVLIGLTLNVVLDFMPVPHTLALRWACLIAGIILCGVATGAYIGAALGPGPRDGLMVGLGRRGHSIRVVRTAIELAVLVTGFLLGGTVGVGTVLFAVSIGPIAHVTIPAFSHGVSPSGHRRRSPTAPRLEAEVACASD